MLNKFLGKFSKSLGIDLGTANTLVYVSGRGIVINEPSIVAVNNRTDKIIAIGEQAKKMFGRTPPHIIVTRPLIGGIISDFEATEKMLHFFIDKVHQEGFTLLPRPRVVIGVPLGITEVERKAVEDSAVSAGAREVYLVDEAMAAALGARLPINEAIGNLVVDLGGGTTEIAVISLEGIVTYRTLQVAGDKLNRDIIQYAEEEFNILLGETMAEDAKIKIGSALPTKNKAEMTIRGRDLITGLPKEITVSEDQIREAIMKSLKIIAEEIKSTIEITPPELVADIYQRGIILCGGGAMLRGLDYFISEAVKIPVYVADDPLTCVVRGTGIILEDKSLLDNLMSINRNIFTKIK
ncbi:MAG: rod shape-determining protein [bacterium]